MPWNKDDIADRVAADLEDGWYVNLGIGLPTSVIGRVPADREVVIQSENGILGVAPLQGEPDDDLLHAGADHVGFVPGAAFFDSVMAFTMIRGGRIDVAILGAYEVSSTGDIANWRNDSQGLAGTLGGIGGAADIAVGAKRLWVLMRHLTADGRPKIVRQCRLPLSATAAVNRIYTDWAVLDVTEGSLRVRALAPEISPGELSAHTEGELDFSETLPGASALR
jgi:3-oxoadipate CoA-transferase, beta subunit